MSGVSKTGVGYFLGSGDKSTPDAALDATLDLGAGCTAAPAGMAVGEGLGASVGTVVAVALGATDGDVVAVAAASGVGVGRTVLARVAVGAAVAVVGTT